MQNHAAGQPTLADVALHAGVSTSTVSRALSRPDAVRSSTRTRVLASVDALGYSPNAGARTLATGRAEAIGVVVPDVTNPYFGGFVRAAQRSAQLAGAAVLIADSRHDPAAEVELTARLAGRVDGLVVCSSVGPTAALRRATAGRPLVLVNRKVRGVSSVVVDQRAIVDLALDHLVALGHRHVGYVAGPGAYWSSRARETTLAERAERDGLAISVLGARAGDETDAEPAVHTILADTSDPITAVITFNDLQALALVGALGRHLRVGTDIAVVGSDGLSMAALVDPPLTTVAAPVDALGAAAVELALDEDRTVRHRVLDPTLVVRASSCPAAPQNSDVPTVRSPAAT